MMLRRGIGFRSVLAGLFLLFAVAVRAQDTGTVTLNFVNADIDAVVKAVGEITGRNFLVDPRVKGTVNIVSAHPVPKALVYPTLLSALRMQGFAAVESEGVVKIVPEVDAKTQGGPVQRRRGLRLGRSHRHPGHRAAATSRRRRWSPCCGPLISPSNTISAYIPNNAIIITDFADNLKRIDQIVASLDHPPGEPVLVHVKNASALDIVSMLNRLLSDAPGQPGAAADAQQRVNLVADPRSNSVMIRSDSAARTASVRQMIEQLDTPQPQGGNVYIVYLKNAEATRSRAHAARPLCRRPEVGRCPRRPRPRRWAPRRRCRTRSRRRRSKDPRPRRRRCRARVRRRRHSRPAGP